MCVDVGNKSSEGTQLRAAEEHVKLFSTQVMLELRWLFVSSKYSQVYCAITSPAYGEENMAPVCTNALNN